MIQGYLIAGLAGLALAVGSSVFVGFKAYKSGEEANEAEHLKADSLARDTRDLALQIAAEAIASQKKVTQVNETRLERELVMVPDFSKCDFGPDVKRVLNDALAGKAPTESITDDELSRDPAPSG